MVVATSGPLRPQCSPVFPIGRLGGPGDLWPLVFPSAPSGRQGGSADLWPLVFPSVSQLASRWPWRLVAPCVPQLAPMRSWRPLALCVQFPSGRLGGPGFSGLLCLPAFPSGRLGQCFPVGARLGGPADLCAWSLVTYVTYPWLTCRCSPLVVVVDANKFALHVLCVLSKAMTLASFSRSCGPLRSLGALHACGWALRALAHIHVCACVYVCLCMCACVCACAHVCVHAAFAVGPFRATATMLASTCGSTPKTRHPARMPFCSRACRSTR